MNSFNPDMWFANENGKWMIERILDLAAWLTGEATPGWISMVLLAALAMLSIWHVIVAWRFRHAISACRSILGGTGGHITGERLLDIDSRFKKLKQSKEPWRQHLANAWTEFRETTILPERGTDKLHNTVHPTVFFAREQLGLERGIWRQVPALFVSVGLFLTFLGLVAALDQTSQILDSATADGDVTMTDGLKTLLRIAGAKFIMSLTGLLCSIVFTLVLRCVARWTDKALHLLSTDIENGCAFLTEQKLLGDLLHHAKEQTDHLKSFCTELVAQIAKPLREDLPETIRASIVQAMAPAMANLSRSTGEGIESMADNVSAQLTNGIQNSVQAMNRAIGDVSRSLESVTERLDQSGSTMGAHIDDAVKALACQIGNLETAMAGSSREVAQTFNEASEMMLQEMNEALQQIRDTSTDGARQIGDASRAMANAAKVLQDTVQVSVVKSAEAGGREIERAGQEMASGIAAATATMRADLLNPMNELVERVQNFASSVEKASDRVGQYTDSVGNSTIAVMSANEGLERSSQILAAAAAPVRDAVTGIEAASQTMGSRVEEASEAMRRTTEHTESVMRSTREAIEASRTTMREALGSLENAVGEFRNIFDRYDQIDRNLGNAFQKIETAVRSSIDEIGAFERNLNTEFGKALNRLQAVIAQAEPFTPRLDE